MGCGNSKIIYEISNNKVKSDILDRFKKIYSNQAIREIYILQKHFLHYTNFYIKFDNYNIQFNREIELIDFISQLERRFIVDNIDDIYFIRFINVLN